jgi:hypothetical protein
MFKISKRVRYIILLVLLLCSIAGVYMLGAKSRPEVFIDNSGAIPHVTISELIENKGHFNNKMVLVSGILWTGFEMCEIYEEETHPLLSNQQAICLEFSDLVDLKGDTISEKRIFNVHGEKVLVVGVYDSARTGHFSVCAGSISGISNITFY